MIKFLIKILITFSIYLTAFMTILFQSPDIITYNRMGMIGCLILLLPLGNYLNISKRQLWEEYGDKLL